MALSQFSLNEQHIIRAFLLQEGRLPTQAELNSAFTKTNPASGLEEAGLNIPNSQESTNTAFVTAMYAAAGIEAGDIDPQGLQYWSQVALESRAQALVDFQFAVREELATQFADELATINDSLTSTNVDFADPDDDNNGGEVPQDVVTEYVWNTEAKNPYDVGQEGNTSTNPDSGTVDSGTPLTDAQKLEEASKKESNSHYIFNIGKDALDQNQPAVTADYTFKLKDQVGADKDYEGYFMSPLFSETGGTGEGSIAIINIYNHFALANDESATLADAQTDAIAFRLNGEKYAIIRDASLEATQSGATTVVVEALGTATDYTQLLAAVQEGLQQLDLGVTATLSAGTRTTEQRDEDNQDTGEDVVFRPLVLTAAQGELSNVLASGTTPGSQIGNGYNAFYSYDVIGGTDGVISTNLELENIGYLSQGGNINLAGQSYSDLGIELFNVKAEDGVWLTTLKSNPLRNDIDYLEEIKLTGSDYFKVGAQIRGGTFDVAAPVSTDAGLVDVRHFDGSAFGGEIQLAATITKDVIARDLNSVDTAGVDADDVVYTYTTASGDDRVLLSVDGEVMEREDASLLVNTGNGDDYVHVDVEFDGTVHLGQMNELVNQQEVANYSIMTGAGNDTVWTEGEGNARIVTDSGNDTIYTDNTGTNTKAQYADIYNNPAAQDEDITEAEMDAILAEVNASKSAANGINAHFVFNAVNGNRGITDLLGNSDAPLSQNGNGVAQVYQTFNNTVEVTFQGLESVYVPVESTNYTTSTLQVNNAIKKAINEDPVLSKLLIAKDGPANTLIVESLIDGKLVKGDLSIDLVSPVAEIANETAAAAAAREAAGIQTVSAQQLQAAAAAYADAGTANPAAVSASNLAAATNSLEQLYSTEFATITSGGQPATYTQVLDVNSIASDNAGFFNGQLANSISVAGVSVGIATGDSAAAIAGKINAAFAADPIVTLPEGQFKVSTAVVGDQVTFTLTPQTGASVPYGEVPAAIGISAQRGAEDGYLSTTEPNYSFTSSGQFTGGPGTVTAQQTTLDFAGIKMAAAGGNTTLTIAYAGDGAAPAAGNFTVTIPQGAGQLQIANLVADAFVNAGGALTGATASVQGTQVTLTFPTTPDATVGQPAANNGNFGELTLTVGTPANVIAGSFPGTAAPNVTFSATNNTAQTGTITQTLDFADLEVTQDGNIVVLGTTVNLTDGLNDVAVAAAVHAALTGAGTAGVTVQPLGTNSTTVSYTLTGGTFGGTVPTAATTGAAPAIVAGTAAVPAVFTVDLAGLVLNFDAGNGGDTLVFTVDGVNTTAYTATADAQGPADAVAALVGTNISLDGVTYAVTAGANASSIVLTGPASAPDSALTISTTDTSTDGANNDPAVTNVVHTGGTAAVSGPAYATSSVGTITVTPYTPTLDGSEGDDIIDGANSTAESDNWVDAGSGTDTIVLSTGANSNEVIKLGGTLGYNTIVNFDDSTPAKNSGGDLLDLTAYLNSQVGAANVNDVTLTTGTTLSSNQVAVLNFSALQGGTASDARLQDSVDLMNGKSVAVSDSDLAAAINAVYNADAANATQNVFLIQNDNATNAFDNLGEYVVVTAQSGTGANGADFTSVQVVGVLDFGEAQNFDANLVTFS